MNVVKLKYLLILHSFLTNTIKTVNTCFDHFTQYQSLYCAVESHILLQILCIVYLFLYCFIICSFLLLILLNHIIDSIYETFLILNRSYVVWWNHSIWAIHVLHSHLVDTICNHLVCITIDFCLWTIHPFM